MKLNVGIVERLLAEKGMTKADLSDRCGISRQSLSTIVRRGTCEPRTMGRLAQGLEVGIDVLIAKEV